MLVILDLDETLIHTFAMTDKNHDKNKKMSDFHFVLSGNYYWVKCRPGLTVFLEYLFKYFDVGVWTAADKQYAKAICKKIFTMEQLKKLRFIYSRELCESEKNGPFTKPLVKVYRLNPSFNSNNTIMIDNSKVTFKHNEYNAIHIPDYVGRVSDKCLFMIRNLMIRYFRNVDIDGPIFPLIVHLNKVIVG